MGPWPPGAEEKRHAALSTHPPALVCRFCEGRLIWGDMLNVSRDLASRLVSLGVGTRWGPDEERLRAFLLRCIRTFPRTLKFRLTVDGFNEHVQVKGKSAAELALSKNAALADELAVVWAGRGPGERHPWVEGLLSEQVANQPLYVLHHMGVAVAQLRARGAIDGLQAQLLENRLGEYARILGASERLLRTPIYTPYTHHTSRCAPCAPGDVARSRPERSAEAKPGAEPTRVCDPTHPRRGQISAPLVHHAPFCHVPRGGPAGHGSREHLHQLHAPRHGGHCSPH